MQASDRVLARRYALALYQSAGESEKERKVGEELSIAVRKLRGNMAAYKHPRKSSEVKKSLLSRELGETVGDLTFRFLGLLVDKKRFTLLPYIALIYGGLCDEGEGILRAKVRAAHELSASEQAEIVKRIGKRLGKKIILNIKIDESLIAGAVVRVGDWVFDASLQGELARMRTQLSSRN